MYELCNKPSVVVERYPQQVPWTFSDHPLVEGGDLLGDLVALLAVLVPAHRVQRLAHLGVEQSFHLQEEVQQVEVYHQVCFTSNEVYAS